MKKGLTVEAVNYIRVEGEAKPLIRGIGKASRNQVVRELKSIIADAVANSNLNGKLISFCERSIDQVAMEIKATYQLAGVSNTTVEINMSTSSSYIQIKHEGGTLPNDHSFFSSPAYRRYFEEHSPTCETLTSTVPSKLMTSRYLGDYVTHLISCCEGYISAIQKVAFDQKIAA